MSDELKFAEVVEATVPLADIAETEPVTERQLREWIADGRLPGYKVGGRLRIKPGDLDLLVERVQPKAS